jgi:protein disulfide-isomerase A6
VKGYPTIKVFGAGPKNKAKDYNGPREASGIVQYALKSLDEAGVPPTISQITSSQVFDDLCAQKGKVCAVLFVPHIYDSSASDRKKFIDQLGEIAKATRGKPLTFGWSEGTSQEALEKALDINFVYPTLALVSAERKVFAVQRVSWSVKNAVSFIEGVMSGRSVNNLLFKL